LTPSNGSPRKLREHRLQITDLIRDLLERCVHGGPLLLVTDAELCIDPIGFTCANAMSQVRNTFGKSQRSRRTLRHPVGFFSRQSLVSLQEWR
jgi:hypothetical protein